MSTVLVVDDDGHIREVVRFALERAGYSVVEAADGAQALGQFEAQTPDVIVLDILLPEMDGLEVCRRIRAMPKGRTVPIIFLSSRDDEFDRVLGLELGADDYVTKPFSPRELTARVKARLRRSGGGVLDPNAGAANAAGEDTTTTAHGLLRLDSERHRAFWGDSEVQLTATEFALLAALLGRPGKVYTRTELVERAYGLGYSVTDRTVDSHVRRIRQKFGEFGGDPVETVYGVGYRVPELVPGAE